MQKARARTRAMQRQADMLKLAMRSAAMSMIRVFVAGGIVAVIRGTLNAIDKLDKLRQRLGVSTEAMSELEHVANLSGVSFETFTMGIQRMTRRIAEAAQGTGEAKSAIAELGLEAGQLARMAPDQQFEALADAIASIEQPADRVRLAMKLFDSEGVALLQTMEKGASGIKAMREEAKRLGISLSQDQVNAAVMAKDAMTRFGAQMRGVTNTAIIALAPALEGIANFLAVHLPSAIRWSIEAFHNLRFFVLKAAQEVNNALVTGSASVSRGAEWAAEKLAGLAEQAREFKAPFLASQIDKLTNALKGTADEADSVNEKTTVMQEVLDNLETEFLQAANQAAGYTVTLKQNSAAAAQVRDALNEATAAANKFAEAQNRAKQIIEQTRTPLEKMNEAMKEAHDLHKRGMIDDETMGRRVKQIGEEYNRATEETRRATEAQEMANRTYGMGAQSVEELARALSGAFTSSINTGNHALDSFLGTLVQVINQMIRAQSLSGGGGGGGIGGFLGTAFSWLGSIIPFGGGAGSSSAALAASGAGGFRFGSGPGLQEGGTARGGQPYVVGEAGPEVFVPGRTGTVVPNDQIGGQNINITINAVDARSVQQLLSENGEVIHRIVDAGNRRRMGSRR